ncbi:hypothetical protein ESCO_006667 [Escovopsis weberi]|uniref:Nascent polypeptide-associated complex subunit alpha-like UBA domain-containing protein n=1 Tax=Escovopsis weberi TaxID=150374 RepID=A0A0M9VXN7_ESCWE|nr:hypothetical protein ESCO_006667 [Escovopsis weberi]
MANEDDSPAAAAKSVEDRKAASALANLDASADDSAAAPSAAASAAAAAAAAAGSSSSASKQAKPAPKKNIKLDPEDVALVVDQLELSKPRAIELLKQHDGSAVAVLRMFAAGYWE